MSDLDSLSAELRVSHSTVRRDIELLEQSGLVKRTHGGVIWVGERSNGTRPYAFDQRMGYNLDAKRRIAIAQDMSAKNVAVDPRLRYRQNLVDIVEHGGEA